MLLYWPTFSIGVTHLPALSSVKVWKKRCPSEDCVHFLYVGSRKGRTNMWTWWYQSTLACMHIMGEYFSTSVCRPYTLTSRLIQKKSSSSWDSKNTLKPSTVPKVIHTIANAMQRSRLAVTPPGLLSCAAKVLARVACNFSFPDAEARSSA